ncbi:MAG TPA: hypothetical protein VF017_15135 [Thermoanaerobaculia bacterium]|nr:hypothetical protein [Thermoanaerobaculia bacterium]
MARHLFVLFLIVTALAPCELPWDGCEEEDSARCTVCHLGCAAAPEPEPGESLAPPAAPELTALAEPTQHLLSRTVLPELPPPRA